MQALKHGEDKGFPIFFKPGFFEKNRFSGNSTAADSFSRYCIFSYFYRLAMKNAGSLFFLKLHLILGPEI